MSCEIRHRLLNLLFQFIYHWYFSPFFRDFTIIFFLTLCWVYNRILMTFIAHFVVCKSIIEYIANLGIIQHQYWRDLHTRFQRQQRTCGGTVRSTRPANCCQHIPLYRFHDGFPDLSQFSAAKLTHYSSKPQRPSDSSRPRQRLLFSGDVHPNHDPTTKYPCPCHESWGELFVQSLIWLGTFEVFWSTKRSGVRTI